MSRAADLGCVIALVMLLTVADDPFDHLNHSDPLVRQSAQAALLRECCRQGENGVRLLERRSCCAPGIGTSG